jgi:murein DD-endopeptidase MepM/ murein hydrolase activator NlpD
MKRLIRLIISACFYALLVTQAHAQGVIDRNELEMQYIKNVKNYDQLQKLLAIMPAGSPHWNYIPSIFPILTTSAMIKRDFGYHYHPIDHVVKFHYAIDIPCALADKVYATAAGLVNAGFDRSGYGNYITINHINGFETLYGHLSAIGVKQGQYVKKGQIIGLAGATGKATGVHVHYAVRKDNIHINPFPFCFVSRKQYLKERAQLVMVKGTAPAKRPGLHNIDPIEKIEKSKKDTPHNQFLEQSFF